MFIYNYYHIDVATKFLIVDYEVVNNQFIDTY